MFLVLIIQSKIARYKHAATTRASAYVAPLRHYRVTLQRQTVISMVLITRSIYVRGTNYPVHLCAWY